VPRIASPLKWTIQCAPKGFERTPFHHPRGPPLKDTRKSCAIDKPIQVQILIQVNNSVGRGYAIIGVPNVLRDRGPRVEMRGVVPWDGSRDGECLCRVVGKC